MECELTLHLETKTQRLPAQKGQILLAALAGYGGFPLDAPCGGLGKCGKCKVTLRRPGETPHEELACQTVVSGNMELWARGTALFAEQGGDFLLPVPDPAPAGALGLAVDLGTTTIAAGLFELQSGRRLDALGEANAQRRFGADVISRISFDESEGKRLLCETVREQLRRICAALCETSGRDERNVRKIALAGNTVMEHFLAGLSAHGLGVAPFRPESLFGCEMDLGLSAPVYLAPCAAAYVGGDITAGLLALDADRMQESFLLIDAGTNGEMVLGEKGLLRCCATAVGPAFEGAEIRCGMSGSPGAIHRVALDERGRVQTAVLGGGRAKGICGSGLVDALHVMLALGAVSESGRLLSSEQAPMRARACLGREEGENVFFLTEERDVFVTAGDVRRLQLAKAAVRAGAEVLMAEAEKLPERVFLAGGFGSKMNVESALKIGMLPPELQGRIRAVGNSALAGAERMLLSGDCRRRAEAIGRRMRYEELSGSAAFSEAYMEGMGFDEF